MHFHHHREPAGCTSDHTDWPDWAVVIIATLDRKAEQLMAAVQADLDAATAVITALDAKVADLEAQLAAAQQPALDSTALNAAVAAADALLNPPAPAPAPAPVGSVVDGGGAADTGGGVVDGGGAAPTVPSVPLA